MTDPGPFVFLSIEPPAELARVVQSIWYARGTVAYDRERIAPTGSTVALLVLGDPIRQTPDDGAGPACTSDEGLLIGPHDRPIVNEPLGETHAVGIVTTPVGCDAVFGIRPTTIRGRVVPLAAHWPGADALRRRLQVIAEPNEMLAAVGEALVATVGPTDTAFDRCEAAVGHLERTPTMPIAEIAAGVGVSHNRLDRDFNRIVGLSPRTLASLLRVRALLARIDPDGPIDWPGLAAELGWYDQAHLGRDVKRYTGVSPTRYVEAQQAYREHNAGGAEVVGFVPE
ncbi:MAG: helix-turn-helix domain-containing protein [Actinomycetota bacterium]